MRREGLEYTPSGLRLRLLCGSIIFVIAGCQPGSRFEAATRRPDSTMRIETIGKTVQGRAIECWSLGEGPDVTLILATIHGDEPAGTPLLKKLADHLVEHPELLAGKRLLLITVANPDGFAAHKRTNAHGVDLNRNYPAANYADRPNHGHGALSEPESKALFDLIQREQPARVVSIHQPIRSGDACIDYDGPAQSLADGMSAASDLPIHKLGGQPGSLGSYVGETLGKPIITIELPAAATKWSPERLWEAFGEMLLAAIPSRGAAAS